MTSSTGAATPGHAAVTNGNARTLMIGLAWLVAANTRTASISVAPMLPLLVPDLGLSGASAGLLFGLVPLCMGVFAIPGGTLIDRIGPARGVTIGLVLIAIGGGGRAMVLDYPQLLVATLAMGIGIGLCGPALPKIVRLLMSSRAGLGTAIYASGYPSGALIGSAISAPWLLPLFGGSWRGVFGFWGAFAAACLVAWVVLARDGKPAGHSESRRQSGGVDRPLRSPLLWLIATIFMIESLIFYTLNAWIVPYYVALGLPLAESSLPLAALSFGGLPGGFLGPFLSDVLHARKPIVVAGCAGTLLGCVGLLLWPLVLPGGWAFLLGFSVASIFTTSLALPVDIAARQSVGAASGVVLSIGYGLAAFGPLGAGALHDLTGTYASSMLALVICAALMLAGGAILPETHPSRRETQIP